MTASTLKEFSPRPEFLASHDVIDGECQSKSNSEFVQKTNEGKPLKLRARREDCSHETLGQIHSNLRREVLCMILYTFIH